MNTKEKYTISEATTLLGFGSRSTINKRTKGQRGEAISYELDENGTKVISLVELQRVFPDRVKQAFGKNNDSPNASTQYSAKVRTNTVKNTTNTVWLAEKVELLEELLAKSEADKERERLSFLERERKGESREEKLQDQITELTKTLSQQTRLLEHHQGANLDKINSSQSKPPNTTFVTFSKELSRTLRFATFASCAAIVLLIILYFYERKNDTSPQSKSFKQYQVQKKRLEPRTSPSLPSKRENRNYTPIPR